jgi:hypothetical protein
MLILAVLLNSVDITLLIEIKKLNDILNNKHHELPQAYRV